MAINILDEDKLGALSSILKESGRGLEEILYIGDEYFDLPLIKQVGFSAANPARRRGVWANGKWQADPLVQ